jgi:hypothetical protein
VDQSHFLWHLSERPEGCRHRPRRCLLKGCERLFWPRHWRTRYCSAACRQGAQRWRRRRASRRYRASENGRAQRQEQSRRYRQRRREATASADEEPRREGQRIASADEDFARRRCARPGCYVFFSIEHEHTCQRFCSLACRLALRRVLDREARYLGRHRRQRRQRQSRRVGRPDTS